MGNDSQEQRPYPNEHSARLLDPKTAHIRVRRTNGSGDGTVQGVKIPSSIAVIWYVVRSGGQEVPRAQALRFPTKNWTVAEAKDWLKKNEIKYLGFEPAQEEESVQDETEKRMILTDDAEIRVQEDDRPRLMGYAAKFGVFADLGGFKERIRAGAFDEALKTSDIRALKNHDPNLLLGRVKSGTLKLESNTVGLHFEIDVPDSTTGRDVVEEVRRGDLTGCSFSFQVAEDVWKNSDDAKPERTITKIGRVYDVGPVTYPAYSETSVAVRSLNRFLAEAAPVPCEQTEQTRKEIERNYIKAGRIAARCKVAIARTA